MTYQLRFLKSTPISAWLNQTTNLLELFIYRRTELSNNSISSDINRRQIRKALIKGFSTFLIKRSLCGIHQDCDLGLQPAVENKSDDRFQAGVINAPVKRYLFQGSVDLTGAVKKMTETMLEYIPEARFTENKIKFILKEALACHLFENNLCFHHAHCRLSHLQKMDKDFASPSYSKTLSVKKESV